MALEEPRRRAFVPTTPGHEPQARQPIHVVKQRLCELHRQISSNVFMDNTKSIERYIHWEPCTKSRWIGPARCIHCRSRHLLPKVVPDIKQCCNQCSILGRKFHGCLQKGATQSCAGRTSRGTQTGSETTTCHRHSALCRLANQMASTISARIQVQPIPFRKKKMSYYFFSRPVGMGNLKKQTNPPMDDWSAK